jgi:uncharacterized lipoprotein YajG
MAGNGTPQHGFWFSALQQRSVPMRTLLAIAAIAALAACGQQTTTETPDTTADSTAPTMPAPAPTTITITEADARTRAEQAGYTNLTGLMQNPDGSWSATATQNGETTTITIGDSGVTSTTSPAGTTPAPTTP